MMGIKERVTEYANRIDQLVRQKHKTTDIECELRWFAREVRDAAMAECKKYAEMARLDASRFHEGTTKHDERLVDAIVADQCAHDIEEAIKL